MKTMKQLLLIGTLGASLLIGGVANAASYAPLWYTNYLQGKTTLASEVSSGAYSSERDEQLDLKPIIVPTPELISDNPADLMRLATEEQQLLTLLNDSRMKRGLQPLKSNSRLVELARLKAKDMAEKHYFSHTSPTYGKAIDMVRNAGIEHWIVGENIAITSSASRANTLFMGSSIHRATMLNSNYTEVGIGMYRTTTGSLYVAEFFIGTR